MPLLLHCTTPLPPGKAKRQPQNDKHHCLVIVSASPTSYKQPTGLPWRSLLQGTPTYCPLIPTTCQIWLYFTGSWPIRSPPTHYSQDDLPKILFLSCHLPTQETINNNSWRSKIKTVSLEFKIHSALLIKPHFLQFCSINHSEEVFLFYYFLQPHLLKSNTTFNI